MASESTGLLAGCRVDHRRLDAAMAQQRLQLVDGAACVQKAVGEAVSELVRMGAHTRLVAQAVDESLNPRSLKPPQGPVGLCQVFLKGFLRVFAEPDDAHFRTLAVDPQR